MLVLRVVVHSFAERADEKVFELVARDLDGDGEARVEAARHALIEAVLAHAELRGRTVGSEDDLLALGDEHVEGVEEELERTRRAGHVLNVVDDEHVDVAVVLREDVRCAAVLVTDGVRVVGDEVGRRLVDADARGVVLRDVVLDGAEKVRLPQPALSIDKEWVVALVLAVGHLECRLIGELVLVADDEAVERELRVVLRDVLDQGIGLSTAPLLELVLRLDLFLVPCVVVKYARRRVRLVRAAPLGDLFLRDRRVRRYG